MNSSNPTHSMKNTLRCVESSLNLAAITIALAGLYLLQTIIA